jgi:hypothetical protein
MHARLAVGLLAATVLAAGAGPAGAQVAFTRADSALGVNLIQMSYGPTWGDFSGDGWDDLFSGNHGAYFNLYLNVVGRSLVDVWGVTGIPVEGDRHGAAWGDADNDGRSDLYIAVGAQMGQGVGYNQLYHNLDGFHFVDIAEPSGTVDSLGRGRFPYWADVDCDGDLDLFVGNMATPNQLFLNRGDLTFDAAPDAGGLASDDLWYAAWTQFDGDRAMDVALAGSWTEKLALFRNLGNGTFTNITTASGLPRNLANVSGLCWIDYDNDGDEDLYCSRGYSPDSGDAFWSDSTASLKFLSYLPEDRQREDGADALDIRAACAGLYFTIDIDWDPRPHDRVFLGASGAHPHTNPFFVGDGSYLGRPPHTPGVDHGCYIWQDVMGGPWHVEGSTDFGAEHRVGLAATTGAGVFTGFATAGLETPVTPPDVDDRLFRNRGNGTFEDVTQAAGIADSLDGHSAICADFDNDGWLDLYVVNGRNLSGVLAHNGPSLLYLNNGDGTFRESAAAAGVANEILGTGAAGAWSDYDHDGFPDLFVTNGYGGFPFNRGRQVVYHNERNANHWIAVRLTGTISCRDAVGAQVEIQAGGRVQRRTQFGGVNDMAQNSTELIFGLGPTAFVERLAIEWPSGATEVFTNLGVNRRYEFVEGQSQAADAGSAPALRLTLDPVAPNPVRGSATLTYRLPAAGPVDLAIFDLAGRRVRTLVSGARPAGAHTVAWDGRDACGRRLPRGFYCSRLRLGDAPARTARLVVD